MLPTITAIGTLRKAPLFQYTAQGDPVCTLSLDLYNTYESNGEEVKEFLFFSVLLYGRLAEVVNHDAAQGALMLVKGQLMHENGKPRLGEYQGVPRAVYELESWYAKPIMTDPNIVTASWHEICLMGNLGQDAELKYTQTNNPYLVLSVASNNKRNGQDETIWSRCTVWGKQAESLAPYLTKGKGIVGWGTLDVDREGQNPGGPRIWVNQNGEPGTNFSVTLRSVQFQSGGGRRDSSGPEPTATQNDPYQDNEFPF